MAWADHLERGDGAAREILGGEVLYTPGVGDAVTVTGIFEERHAEPGAGARELDVGDWGPAVFLTLADLPSDPEVDSPTITVAGTTYTVRVPHKDGHGGVLLLLNKPEA